MDGFFSRFPCELGLYSRLRIELQLDIKGGLDVRVLDLGKRYFRGARIDV